VERTFAIAPSAGVKLRDAGVKTPDFLVIGNGRAVVIEMDGPHHYTTSRKADDATRDRHWSRCDVHTVRHRLGADRGRTGPSEAVARGAAPEAVAEPLSNRARY